MSYFECRNLYKTYPEVTVDFSFVTEKGSMTCIVGPSGSGKSTILRMISGLIELDDAKENNSDVKTEIILDGKDITFLPPSKRDCGMVFQNSALFLHMNVEENIAYGLKCRGMSKSEWKPLVREYLEKVKLSGYEKRNVSTLSGGEAQRVALARTLIVKPKLILFDEPLSALDAPLRKQLAQEIRELQKQYQFTAIMVTHDVNEAKSISDKIILIKNGRNVWEGKPVDFSEDLIR